MAVHAHRQKNASHLFVSPCFRYLEYEVQLYERSHAWERNRSEFKQKARAPLLCVCVVHVQACAQISMHAAAFQSLKT